MLTLFGTPKVGLTPKAMRECHPAASTAQRNFSSRQTTIPKVVILLRNGKRKTLLKTTLKTETGLKSFYTIRKMFRRQKLSWVSHLATIEEATIEAEEQDTPPTTMDTETTEIKENPDSEDPDNNGSNPRSGLPNDLIPQGL